MTASSSKQVEGSDGPQLPFEELVRRHRDMVFNLSYRLLGDREAAEDLTQEVFLRVFRSLDGFRGDSSAKTWIYRITLNAASNQRKRWARRSRRRHVSLEDRPHPDGPTRGESLENPGPGPERRTHGDQVGDRIQEALGRLPEEYRQAVVLRDVEGLSYQEIAEAMDIAEGTVKSRIGRGRARLREALEDLL